MAVHMAAADDVFGATYFLLSFPTWCLGWDLGLECVSSLEFSYLLSTLVISKSNGPSEILRDIRTSTYQMCRTGENTNRTAKFHK